MMLVAGRITMVNIHEWDYDIHKDLGGDGELPSHFQRCGEAWTVRTSMECKKQLSKQMLRAHIQYDIFSIQNSVCTNGFPLYSTLCTN